MRLPNGIGTVYKLSGKRRNPYIVRKTKTWDINTQSGRVKQKYITIGYAPTRAKGLAMLMQYNENPYDLNANKVTFSEIYEKWSKDKFNVISKSNILGYQASYNLCGEIYNKPFKDIKLAHLQYIVDTCDKNYPTLRKLRVLFHQLYNYALKYDVCQKDYSEFVDISKFKNRNPNSINRTIFYDNEIELLWSKQDDKYFQTILMLIYTGVRISELLDLKKCNINMEQHYFDIIKSKTDNGIRKIPIADKIYPFFEQWYNNSNCDYLLNINDKHITYRNYYDTYWQPAMQLFNLKHTPHDTRHTCSSLLVKNDVNMTVIKKILGHSGAMSLTEKVYTHVDIKELLNAINKI